MGFLLKIFLFILVIGFILNQIGRFFFKYLFKKLNINEIIAEQERQQKKQRTYKRKKGNLEIEYISKEAQDKHKRGKNFKGGDYIDFEEV